MTKLADFESPPVDDEERYSPQPPHQRRFRRPLVGLLALLLVAVAGVGVAYGWTRTQYFVGPTRTRSRSSKGYRKGCPACLCRGFTSVQQLALSELPPFYQEQVKANIDVASLDSARETVAELSEAAKRCAGPQRAASPRPKSTAGQSQALHRVRSSAATNPSPAPVTGAGGAELLIMRVVAPVTVVPRRRRGLMV